MSNIVESGLRPGRLEYVRETTFGTPPTNPAWSFFSDIYQSVGFGPGPNISPRRKVGDEDVQAFNAGAENNSFDVTFDQQVWFDSGAAGDAITRQSNGCLYSYTIVERIILGTGLDGGDRRLYTVVTGAKPDTLSVTGEPESGDPIITTLNYLAQKVRAYIIDQPGSSTGLTVESTDAGDSGATYTVSVEDDGAAIAEQLQLNGTTPVATSSSAFTSVDAFFYDGSATPQGDIILKTAGGTTLATIYGADSYQDREHDTGVPLLGTGSHASAIGSAYENLIGDTIERPSATSLLDGVDITTFGFTVNNNLQAEASHLSIGRKIYEGARDITIEGSIFGEKAGFEAMSEAMRKVENDIVWTLSGGSLTFTGAVLTDIGGIVRETEQAVMTVDTTFMSKGLTIA